MGVFDKAIEEVLAKDGTHSQPRSFIEYCAENNLTANTAAYISIDDFDKLKPELKDSGFTVLRLGRRSGTNGTYFSLVKWLNHYREYFLIDDEIFKNVQPVGFIPEVPFSELHCFSLLDSHTETTVVNLGLASGLFRAALKLEKNPSIPATGRGNYSFEVAPNMAFPDLCFKHICGQVEIDSVFTSKRNGRDCIFLLEAKCSSQLKSLSKHKLAYSYWAIRDKLPNYIDLVPVYCRVLKSESSYMYYIAECCFDGKYLSSLEVKNIHGYEMQNSFR